jgi:hypothetical protein
VKSVYSAVRTDSLYEAYYVFRLLKVKKQNISANTRKVVYRKYNPAYVQYSTQYSYTRITNFCFRFLMRISLYTVHIKFFRYTKIHVDKKKGTAKLMGQIRHVNKDSPPKSSQLNSNICKLVAHEKLYGSRVFWTNREFINVWFIADVSKKTGKAISHNFAMFKELNTACRSPGYVTHYRCKVHFTYYENILYINLHSISTSLSTHTSTHIR